MFITGLEEQLSQLTEEKRLQTTEFIKKEEESSLERKQLKQQLKDVKALDAKKMRQITQLETRDVERNQQLAVLKAKDEEQDEKFRKLETQNQQLVSLNGEHQVKILKLEAELAKNKLQITKLTDQSEEKTTLLEGQGRELSGLLKQHSLFCCYFDVEP